MADCERRDVFCLPFGSHLVPLFASPVAGLTAGAAFAAAGVGPARHVVASAVAVAVLTLVTCGAIGFATPPMTTIGRVLPPTWVLVVLAGARRAVRERQLHLQHRIRQLRRYLAEVRGEEREGR